MHSDTWNIHFLGLVMKAAVLHLTTVTNLGREPNGAILWLLLY